MYNTLDSVNALMDSGFTHQQAQAMVTVMTDNLATKEDIEVLRRAMEGMETSLRRDMKDGNDKLETSLRSGLQEMKVRFDYQFLFLKWVGAISVGGILTISATAFTLLRLLP